MDRGINYLPGRYLKVYNDIHRRYVKMYLRLSYTSARACWLALHWARGNCGAEINEFHSFHIRYPNTYL